MKNLFKGVAVGSLFYSLPYLGTGLIMFLVTAHRHPLFGTAATVLLSIHLPLFLLQRRSTIRFGKENLHCHWRPGTNSSLLRTSFALALFLTAAGVVLLAIRG